MYFFIRLVQSYNDPVWGQQALTWIKTPLIRVYRTRRHVAFEWVGHPKEKCDFAHLREIYPIAVYPENIAPDRFIRKPRLP